MDNEDQEVVQQNDSQTSQSDESLQPDENIEPPNFDTVRKSIEKEEE